MKIVCVPFADSFFIKATERYNLLHKIFNQLNLMFYELRLNHTFFSFFQFIIYYNEICMYTVIKYISKVIFSLTVTVVE